ncbi:MAG: ABC transporter permease [Phycisphaerae bacterium]|nr:ABC transporter permease [Phycisphaerae bacterium]
MTQPPVPSNRAADPPKPATIGRRSQDDRSSPESRRDSSQTRQAMRRFFRSRLVRVGLAMLVLIALACVAGFLYGTSPEDQPRYNDQNLTRNYQPPSRSHWFGTDDVGRDVLVRTLYGGAISLAVGMMAALVSVAIGVTWGAIAGYVGGKTDSFMMRIVDVLYGLPYLLLVILFAVAFGGAGSPVRRMVVLFLAIGAVSWLTMARVVRGQVLSLRNNDYVLAAVAAGASHARIIFVHLLPNLLGPIIVYATLIIPQAILQESFLSFLSIGVQPPAASWGSLAADGIGKMNPVISYWWLTLFPCLALALTLLSLNLIGDGLRDAFDPQLREKK